MTLRTVVLISTILWHVADLFSQQQDLPDPGTRSTTMFTLINDDYGPRNRTTGSNPHIGIDYNIRSGRSAYAVEGGTITAIEAVGTEFAYIKIGSWRYLHMEDFQTLDQSWEVFQQMNGANSYNLIVQRELIGGNLVTTRVLGPNNVPWQTFLDPVNGQTVTIDTRVAQRDWVFVANSENNHLHLDRGVTGPENPLKFVAYNNSKVPILNAPAFKRIITINQNMAARDFPNLDIIYGNKASPVIIEADIDVTHDKDLDSLAIFIRPSRQNTTFALREWTYEGPGIQAGDIRVLNSLQAIRDDIIPDGTSTKVYPVRDVISRDIFKYRWNSKQQNPNEDAPINEYASFRDGKYDFKFVAFDIRGGFSQAELSRVIDNFRPYVKRVTVESEGNTLYHGEWTFDDAQGRLVYGPESHPNDNIRIATNGEADIEITIEFSEPMKKADITQIGNWREGVLPKLESSQPENERTRWSLTLNSGFFRRVNGPLNGVQSITITGRDLADNDLLRIDNTNPINPATSLTRDANGIMQGTPPQNKDPEDTIHRFEIAEAVAFWIDISPSMLLRRNLIIQAYRDILDQLESRSQATVAYSMYWYLQSSFPVILGFSKLRPTQDWSLVDFALTQLLGLGSGGQEQPCDPTKVIEACRILPDYIPKGGTVYLFSEAPPGAGREALDARIAELQKSGIKVNPLIINECLATSAPGGLSKGPSDPGNILMAVNASVAKGNKGYSASPKIDAQPLSVYEAYTLLAEQTGGKVFFVDETEVQTATKAIVSDQLLSSKLLIRNAAGVQSYSTQVDSSVSEIAFTLNERPGANVDLVILRPNGSRLDSSDADVSLLATTTFQQFSVSNPAASDWTVNVNGTGEFVIDVATDSPIELALLSTPVWTSGQPQIVQAVLSGGDQIAAAAFNLVTLDGGTATPLSLFDDGVHNDFGAGDGIYGGMFTPSTNDTFRIQAVGTTTSGESFVREDRLPIIIGTKPNIEIMPSSLSATLELGGVTSAQLTISNTGADTLRFAIEEVASHSSSLIAIQQPQLDPLSQRFNSSVAAALHPFHEIKASLDHPEMIVLTSGEAIADSIFYDTSPPVQSFVGFASATPFWAATRFMPTAPFSLTHVRAFFRTETSSAPIELRVFEHDAVSDNPGAVLFSKSFSGSAYLSANGAYFLLTLDDTLAFAAGEDFWIGLGFQDVPLPQGTTSSGIDQTDRARGSSDGVSWSSIGDLGNDGNDDALVIRALSTVRGDMVSWLAFNPSTGEVPPGENVVVNVDFTTNGIFSNGTYLAVLNVTSNDPDAGLLRVPVELVVNGCQPNGDVNADGSITSGDALLAMQIFLGSHQPVGCEFIAADVNCSNAVTPADALTIFKAALGTPIPPCGSTLAKSVQLASAVSMVKVGQVTGAPGDTISVPLRVGNARGLSAFGLELRYPPAQLAFLEVAKTASTKDWFALQAIEVDEGVVRVGGFHPAALSTTGSGAIAEVRFIIKPNAAENCRLEIVQLTDDLANANVENGTVTFGEMLPTTFALHQNYPNPFNPDTKIRFDIPDRHDGRVVVRLAIYNISGQLVRLLVDEQRAPGRHEILWDGRDAFGKAVAAGTYFYKMTAGDFTAKKKMLLVK